ncbi:MAG: rod shape-determining protein MreC [Actinobacteria bacterium]|nr:rod shape-determining protein MreC [Actinomycetota bacterium]
MLSRRTRIVLSVLVVTALTFIILDLRGGEGPLTGVRNVAANALGGLERIAATAFSPITNATGWWSTMRDQATQIENLTKENDRLRGESETFANDRARVAALDGLLRVASVGEYRMVPAEVIAVGPAQDFSWTVTIDAGKDDGIEPDMTVINGEGLVGRVLKTTANTSTVVLIVDATSAVGGRVAGSEEIGIVSGTGRQDSLEFQLLDPLADLRIGDSLVTFGSKGGRPFAPGLPIGEVVEVSGTPGQLTRVATVKPFIDVSTLSVVGVVTRPPRTDPRDSVLPKSATVNPSPSPVPLGSAADAAASESPSPSTDDGASIAPTPAPAPTKETAATLQPRKPKKASASPS